MPNFSDPARTREYLREYGRKRTERRRLARALKLIDPTAEIEDVLLPEEPDEKYTHQTACGGIVSQRRPGTRCLACWAYDVLARLVGQADVCCLCLDCKNGWHGTKQHHAIESHPWWRSYKSDTAIA